MKVLNIHERELQASAEQVGKLIDSLASEADALWPLYSWPRIKFDRPLAVGAIGGHGPIRYFVEEYVPGHSIRFRFTRPKGYHGYHSLDIVSVSGSSVILKHTLQMTTHGPAILIWIIFRYLHDALAEDALAMAQASLGLPPSIEPWSLWVKLIRWILSGGKSKPQVIQGLAKR